MKRFIALFLVACMSLSLIAVTAFGEAAKPTTIRIYTHWGESYKHEGLEKLFDALEAKQSDYVYEATHLSGDTLVERVMMEVASGEGPDLISGRASDRTEFIDADYIQELDGSSWIQDWNQNLLKCDTYKDHIYGLPYDVEVGGVWYNMDVLNKYDLSIPTTKADYIKMCDTLVANGVTPIAFGAAEADPCQYTMTYFVNAALHNDGTFDANKALLEGTGSVKDIPAYREALLNAYEMFIPYLNEADLGITRENTYEQFLAGERAIAYQGNFVVGVYRSAKPDCNVAFGPIPQYDDEAANLVGTTSDNDLLVMKTGNVEGAKLFIDFMASEEGRKIWADATGCLSASNDALADSVDAMNASAYEWVKANKVYMRGDLVTLSGNVNSEWQNLAQKFIVEGYAAWKNNTPAESFVDAFLEEADARFSALF